MNKPIAIVAGEPNSISSEIIFKTWKFKKKLNIPFLIIGSFDLLKLQKKKLRYKINIKKIDKNFSYKELISNELPIININYKQKKPFEKISVKSNKYIFDCFSIALELSKMKKINGFINCPVSKETLFKNKHQGITEFLANKSGKKGEEVMLIYNQKLAVTPITTHIPLSRVNREISKIKIIKKVLIIDNFYKKYLGKKPNFGILGLNPHNSSSLGEKGKDRIIYKAIKELKRKGVSVSGPLSPDSSFVIYKKYKFDIIIGMYHDQVLTPFKALFNFNAINVTLGLPYVRVSPDHGVAENIKGKMIANPSSLIESIKFFKNIK